MEKYNILWIDDDVNGPELMSDRDALEELHCNITPIPHPDLLQIDSVMLYDCVIIDLSMPKGKLSTLETHGGSRTGFVVLQKIQEKYPELKKYVYSVFDVSEVKQYCEGKPNLRYENKSNYDSDQFAQIIVKFINGESV